jgi:hypothetical protein
LGSGDTDNAVFRHSTYKETLGGSTETNAKSLLEQVKRMLLVQYGEQISIMLSQIPIRQLMCMSLFKWNVTREMKVGDTTLGDLEYQGIVFFEHISRPHGDPTYTIQLPLLLTLVCETKSATRSIMLLNHFDVMLSSDENERNSLAMLVLKCKGLQETYKTIKLKDLLPLESFPKLAPHWKDETLEFTSFKQATAEKQVTIKNWDVAFEKFKEKGAFVQNCRTATFGDMIIVPKAGTFALIFQEKQGERAKLQQIAGATVPTRCLDDVREEHEKCNVSTSHLFVFITDEDFADCNELQENEIVLSYSHHEAAWGPLLALLRKFNHSNIRKTAIA